MRNRNLPHRNHHHHDNHEKITSTTEDQGVVKLQALLRGRKARNSFKETEATCLYKKILCRVEKLERLAGVNTPDEMTKTNRMPSINSDGLAKTLGDDEDGIELASYSSSKTVQVPSNLTYKNTNNGDKDDQISGEEENEEDRNGYILSESMWDVSILLGIVPDDVAGSLFCALLLLVNIMIQMIFAYILLVNLTQKQFTDNTILGFREWRRNIAHSSSFMEANTQVSLASRVCSAHAGLELSGTQSSAHVSFLSYLQGHGVLMCALTIILWVLTVLKELTSALSFIRGIWYLPRGKTFFGNDNMSSIAGISDVRRSLILLVQLCRLFVVITLGYSGITWLGNTVSVTDLVLNAVALEFVLCVDEIIFEALAPRRTRKLIEGLSESPLVLPPSKAWKGLDRNALLLFIMVTLISAYSLVTVVLPFEHRLKLADDALCAGEQNFVYAVNGAGIPAWAESEPYQVEIGAAPSTKSAGTQNWGLTGTLKVHEDATLNFATKMVDNLIHGYTQTDTDCGDDIHYRLVNQTLNFPYRPDVDGILELSFCESEYYVGLVDIYGSVVTEFTEAQRDCCLAGQIHIPNILGGRLSIKGYETETTSNAMEIWNPVCVDILGVLPTNDPVQPEMIYPFTNLLAGSLGDSLDGRCGTCPADTPFCNSTLGECVNVTCADFKQYCFDDTSIGIRARQFCPITCECHNPMSAQVLNDPEYGCPSSCDTTEDYDDAVANITCVDVAANSSLIQKHIDDVEKVVDFWPGLWKEQWDTTISPVFEEYGCAAIDIFKAIDTAPFDFCSFDGSLWPVKPISYICPISCGCDVTMIWGCPSECE